MSSTFIDQLTCANVRSLSPYESARRLYSGGQYWLNANESPYSNAYQIDSDKLNRYPECQPAQVVQSYAAYTGVESQQVLISRGADEGIELLIRAFCNPGVDSIAICPPTYGMYAISAETFNVGVTKAPLTDRFELDFDTLGELADSQSPPKLVFLCSPNNPTGTRLAADQIERCLALFANKSLVVLDEAYIEFDWQNRWSGKLTEYDNLVILRTLSKAFALAGIRCGFTLASPQIIQTLLKVIAPYPVSEPVAQIATQALSTKGIAQMRSQVQAIQQQQNNLKAKLGDIDELQQIGDQCANFLLYRTKNKAALMDYLVENGLLIRDQSKQLQLQDCLRMTIGNAQENSQLIGLITEFYQQESIG
ncbi:MAG: histidinol-phosphate transaminase [Aestuariibacter sp.]